MMVQIKVARCDTCGKIKPVRMAFKADGILHCYCDGCWEAERPQLVQRAVRGDLDAMVILDAVVNTLVDGMKPKPKTDD
jgi:hypothetical protein